MQTAQALPLHAVAGLETSDADVTGSLMTITQSFESIISGSCSDATHSLLSPFPVSVDQLHQLPLFLCRMLADVHVSALRALALVASWSTSSPTVGDAVAHQRTALDVEGGSTTPLGDENEATASPSTTVHVSADHHSHKQSQHPFMLLAATACEDFGISATTWLPIAACVVDAATKHASSTRARGVKFGVAVLQREIAACNFTSMWQFHDAYGWRDDAHTTLARGLGLTAAVSKYTGSLPSGYSKDVELANAVRRQTIQVAALYNSIATSIGGEAHLDFVVRKTSCHARIYPGVKEVFALGRKGGKLGLLYDAPKRGAAAPRAESQRREIGTLYKMPLLNGSGFPLADAVPMRVGRLQQVVRALSRPGMTMRDGVWNQWHGLKRLPEGLGSECGWDDGKVSAAIEGYHPVALHADSDNKSQLSSSDSDVESVTASVAAAEQATPHGMSQQYHTPPPSPIPIDHTDAGASAHPGAAASSAAAASHPLATVEPAGGEFEASAWFDHLASLLPSETGSPPAAENCPVIMVTTFPPSFAVFTLRIGDGALYPAPTSAASADVEPIATLHYTASEVVSPASTQFSVESIEMTAAGPSAFPSHYAVCMQPLGKLRCLVGSASDVASSAAGKIPATLLRWCATQGKGIDKRKHPESLALSSSASTSKRARHSSASL